MTTEAAGQDDSGRSRERELIEAARQEALDFQKRRAALPAAPALPPAGSFPGYRVIREIHRGGQGIVYQAIQESTNREVALKVMLDGPFANERALARFEREVKLVAGFRHPNVVVVHDSGMTHGRHYYAMDYVQGLPLDEYVRSKDFSASEIVRLFSQVCDAVSYGHRRGVIHRDLKPSNILVSESGTPYVVDFGLAKVTAEEVLCSDARRVSLSGHLVGTLAYMSPEQTIGDPGAIDVCTDVYSLGVILYLLLTGAPPYDTKSDITRTVRNIREIDPPRLSKLSKAKVRKGFNSELYAIVLKAMEKEPARRYQSANELNQDLAAWLEGRPVRAKSASPLYRLRKFAARHSLETVVLGILIMAMVGFSAASYKFYKLGEQLAAKDLRRANTLISQRYEQLQQDLERATAAAAQAGRERALASFLLAYHTNQLDRARQIQAQTAKDALQYGAVMAFLLDDSYSVETLRGKLSADRMALLHFAAGERAFKAGDFQEARRSFELCLRTEPGDWLRSYAQSRMDQLRAATAPGG